ncbi:MFS transporter [Candidatus Poribacteria bacterium]
MSKNISPNTGRKLFLAGTFFFWIGLYVFVPILAPYAKDNLGSSLVMVGLVTASYGFTQLLFRLPIGIWSDRRGKRKPFILSAYILIFVSCIGLARSPNAWVLLGFRGLTGVAASMWVAFAVLYSSYFRESEIGRAMSHITTCLGLGQMVSGIGGRIAAMYSRIVPFYVGAGLSVLGMAFMIFIPENMSESKTALSFRSVLAVAKRRRLLIVSIITALSQFAVFTTTQSFLPIYATKIGATDTHLGILWFIINACQTLSMFLAGTVIAPRIGYKAAVGLAYASIMCATFATPWIQSVHLLLLIQGAGALGRGLAYPLLMGLAIQGVPQAEKATAMGFFQAVYAIGMCAGPAIGGFVGKRFGIDGIFLYAGAVYLIAAVMGIVTLPKRVNNDS